MRLLISLALAAPLLGFDPTLPYFSVLSQDPGAWPAVLSSVGLQTQPAALARVFVARSGASASPEWPDRVERGAILILEGESSLAELFGFSRTRENVRAGSLIDVHNPKLPIVWAKALELPVMKVPEGSRVFATERWSGAPMLAGLRKGTGAVLWAAVPPGEHGYERFPYLLQALRDLGLDPPFRSSRLWAFFDYSYRMRVDPDYFAARWRKAGVAGLHVAAWHFHESDPARDAYLKQLIESCHRAGILVYAWLELPHVSEKFWSDHPEWREKTALLQDAHLDWRKLMNLVNRDCFRAVREGVRELVGRFDWDGVNLAELYFESLEGIGNASRFTPMNHDVRAEFRRAIGFDPVELFASRRDAASQRAFLDFRAELAGRLQEEWIAELDTMRRAHPHLDLVLTHVDDRLDTGMRDAIGADASRVLPLLARHNFTFLIEDPATVWHLGANRYGEIARRYASLTTRREKLAIDLNIVERYQNVYPTKQQTGIELFQLIHHAVESFDRVALYFENSLLAPDLELLPSAAAAVTRVERIGGKLVVDSPAGVGVPWRGGAAVDGLDWPVLDRETVWLPAGAHALEKSARRLPLTVLRFTGALRGASVGRHGEIELSYTSASRAIAVLSRAPDRMEIDGAEQRPLLAGASSVVLPRGQHVAVIFPATP
jgi:hypothetical protein